MTAKTVGSFQVLGEKVVYICIYRSNLNLLGTPPYFRFRNVKGPFRKDSWKWGVHICSKETFLVFLKETLIYGPLKGLLGEYFLNNFSNFSTKFNTKQIKNDIIRF